MNNIIREIVAGIRLKAINNFEKNNRSLSRTELIELYRAISDAIESNIDIISVDCAIDYEALRMNKNSDQILESMDYKARRLLSENIIQSNNFTKLERDDSYRHLMRYECAVIKIQND